MSAIAIKHRYTSAILWSGEAADLGAAVQAALSARANLADADLAGAYLADADLAGADLARANLAGAYLARANLAGAYLAGANLARANLAGADLAGADLARANLAGAYLADAYLADADLAGAYLADADLADADLAGARNVPAGVTAAPPATPREPYERKPHRTPTERMNRYRELHPEIPVVERLDARILEAIDTGSGVLDMKQWHTCETTHCVAGWAIHLAGKAGYDLEAKLVDPQRAGRAIYLASTGHTPHFFATNEQAIEGLRRRAATG